MNFLYSGIFWFLCALAVPIIIHLFYFRKTKTIFFSNNQFIKNIQYKYAGKRNLKNFLILLLRCLIFFFLVTAFAYPYWKGKTLEQNTGICVFYLDNSNSMKIQGDANLSLLENAKKKILDISKNYNENTLFLLLTNDFSASGRHLVSKNELGDKLLSIKANAQKKSFSQIISKLKSSSFLNASKSADIYLLSDFQENMTSSKVDAWTQKLTLIPLIPKNKKNISIDTLKFLNPILRSSEQQKIVFSISNQSDEDLKDFPVELYLNDKLKSSSVYNIPKESKLIDTLSLGYCDAGWNQGLLKIKDHYLDFDNQLYFGFKVIDKYKVLIINENQPNHFLSQLFAIDDFFDVQQTQISQLKYDSLNDYSFIILNEVSHFSSGLTNRLKEYLNLSNGIAVIPNHNGDLKELTNFLSALQIDAPTQLSASGQQMNVIDAKNPFFEGVFETSPRKINMPKIDKFFPLSKQYRARLSPILSIQNEPVLGLYKYGSGQVFVFTFPFDKSFGNFQEHALFVPIIFKMMFTSGFSYPPYLLMNANNSVRIQNNSNQANELPVLMKDDFEIIPDVRRTTDETYIYFSDQIKEEGIYEVKIGADRMALLAFNPEKSESILAYLTQDEIAQQLPGFNLQFINSDEAFAKTTDQLILKENFPLWKWFVLLALLCFVIEWILVLFYDYFFKSKSPQQI